MCDLEDQCYNTYGLRSLSHDERLDLIEHILKYSNDVGVLVIDGVADLVSDVNNIEESNRVVGKIMKWTEEYQCHIITVIHRYYTLIYALSNLIVHRVISYADHRYCNTDLPTATRS